MPLNIRNAEADRLAAKLAALTGESKTRAVIEALKDRVALVTRGKRRAQIVADRLNQIATHCAALRVFDARNPDEMLYDERGLPK